MNIDNILYEIFSHLNYSHLFIASMVSNKWYNVSYNMIINQKFKLLPLKQANNLGIC